MIFYTVALFTLLHMPKSLYAEISSSTRGLHLVLSLHPHLYFVYATTKLKALASFPAVQTPEPSSLDNAINTKFASLDNAINTKFA